MPSQVSPAVRQKIVAAINNGIDPDLVEAIALVEGSGNPNQQHVLDTNGKYSYGMMQIQYGRAYDNGFSAPSGINPNPPTPPPNKIDLGAKADLLVDPSELNNVDTNLKYAVKAIGQNINRAGGYGYDPRSAAALASGYNAYRPTSKNIGYQRAVLKKWYEIKGQAYQDVATGAVKQTGPSGTTDVGGHKCVTFDKNEVFEEPPFPSSPYHATVKIRINDFDLTPSRPEFLINFQYIENISLAPDNFRATIFDPTWTEVEVALLKNRFGTITEDGFVNIELSFGYVEIQPELGLNQGRPALWSSKKYMRVTEYHIEYLGYGVQLEISGIGIDGILQGTTSGPGSRLGDIHEPNPGVIAKKFADAYGFTPCIEPTEDFTLDGKVTTLSKGNMDDMTFMGSRVASVAKAANSPNTARYLFKIDTDTTPPTMHFHTPLFHTPPTRIYTYGGSRIGTVIEYKPHINSGFNMMFEGGANVWFGGHNRLNKEPYEDVMNNDSTPEKPALSATTPKDFASDVSNSTPAEEPNFSPTQLPAAKSPTLDMKAGMRLEMPYTSKDMAAAQALNIYEGTYYSSLEADLLVVGDPLLKTMRKVAVVVKQLTNDEHGGKEGIQEPHYANKVWFITTAVHYISVGGVYTTNLKLMADGIFGSTDDGGGMEANASVVHDDPPNSSQVPITFDTNQAFEEPLTTQSGNQSEFGNQSVNLP